MTKIDTSTDAVEARAEEKGKSEDTNRLAQTVFEVGHTEGWGSAIEAAVQRISDIQFTGTEETAWDRWNNSAVRGCISIIRALHDADTLAAIERIKEQARQEERERLTDIIRMYPKPHSNRIIESIMDDE